MRKLFLAIALIMGVTVLSANDLRKETQQKDVIVLKNNMSFQGRIVKVKSCEIVFKTEKGRFNVPLTDVQIVDFAEQNEKMNKQFNAYQMDPESCAKGVTDAQDFHGKGGLHFALGVLFGPFTVIGAAIAGPTPASGSNTALLSPNKELFSDPEYLHCYKKKARGKNVLNAALGWGAITVVLLIAGGN